MRELFILMLVQMDIEATQFVHAGDPPHDFTCKQSKPILCGADIARERSRNFQGRVCVWKKSYKEIRLI